MAHFRHQRHAIVERLLVIAALVGFLGGTIGVPVVLTNRGTKDRSQPYPCMDHACGCRSAEACWRSCCCFTNGQKLAWAAENGVKPPEYVFAAAAKEKPATAVARCCESHGKTCCEQKMSCCEHEDESSHVQAEVVHQEREEVELSDGWSIEFVSAIEARKCQGQAELWLALGAVAPAPAKVELNLEALAVGSVENVCPSLVSVAISPDAPPPRV